jgi:hypothetical protein
MIIDYPRPIRVEFLGVGSDRFAYWRLIEPFEYTVDGRPFTVQAGRETNFGSIPPALWAVLSPYELGVGVVPHDDLYVTHEADKATADLILKAFMEKDEINFLVRQVAYFCVKNFGEANWNDPSGFKRGLILPGTMTPKQAAWKRRVEGG